MTERETIADVRRLSDTCGIAYATWRPGGGVRYRFFAGDAGGTDYFGGSHPLGTSLGAKAAMEWLRGYRAAQLNEAAAAHEGRAAH